METVTLSNKYEGKPRRTCGGVTRYSSNNACVACAVNRSRARDTEAHKEMCKSYYRQNATHLKTKATARYAADTETAKLRRKNYCKNNPDKVALLSMARLSKKRGATPSWLTAEDKVAIRSIYKKARELTASTGISFHVDHIHPLNGKNFSGLHVPWNLQVLRATENMKKSNKLEVKHG